MADYVLYGAPGRASIAPHILLEELAAPCEHVIVDLDAGAHRTPAYLRLNPSGRVPALVHGDLAISEAAAICLYLADRHPEARLIGNLGTADRARAYQLLIFLSNTVQPAQMEYFYPARYAAGVADEPRIMAAAEDKLAAMWQQIDRQIDGQIDRQIDGQLCGHTAAIADRFGVCDAYLYMLASWHRDAARPLTAYPALWRVLTATAARPSVRRVALAHRVTSAAWWAAATAMDPTLRD